MNTANESQRKQFEQQGYIVVRNAVSNKLTDALKSAVQQLLDRGISVDASIDIRWIDEAQRISDAISDVLSPQKFCPAFGELFEKVTLPFAESLLQTDVRCSWLTLFVGGAGYHYGTPLHRDNNIVGPGESDLFDKYHMQQCYFQVPLLPNDNFLQVIPGSYLRPAKEAEIAAADHDWQGDTLPGMIIIELQPGDVVYRHTNMLHRGWNPHGNSRWTLVSGSWASNLPMLEIEKQDYDTVSEKGFVEVLLSRLQSSVNQYIKGWESRWKLC